MEQAELFETAPKFPSGFRYLPEPISRAEERRLVDSFQRLEFKPFEFHGLPRRIVSFTSYGGAVEMVDQMLALRRDLVPPIR
jgi:hypothetical protein